VPENRRLNGIKGRLGLQRVGMSDNKNALIFGVGLIALLGLFMFLRGRGQPRAVHVYENTEDLRLERNDMGRISRVIIKRKAEEKSTTVS
jgi:hypothetical protein